MESKSKFFLLVVTFILVLISVQVIYPYIENVFPIQVSEVDFYMKDQQFIGLSPSSNFFDYDTQLNQDTCKNLYINKLDEQQYYYFNCSWRHNLPAKERFLTPDQLKKIPKIKFGENPLKNIDVNGKKTNSDVGNR